MQISSVDLDKYTPSENSTQGSAIHCDTHGTIYFKRFMMPAPYSYVVADYVCGACFEDKFPDYQRASEPCLDFGPELARHSSAEYELEW